jgi:hypothetical protein
VPRFERSGNVDAVGEKKCVWGEPEKLIIVSHRLDDVLSGIIQLEIGPEIQKQPCSHNVLAKTIKLLFNR